MTAPRAGQRRHAVRVALLATATVAVLYAVVVGVFDLVVVHRLVQQVDGRIADRLRDATSNSGTLRLGPNSGDAVPAAPHGDADVDSAPVFLWRVDGNGAVVGSEAGSPTLLSSAWARSGSPTTATLGASAFRLQAVRNGGGWLVAGASLAEERHVESLLFLGEGLAAPIVVLGMFLGALLIGMKASAPVEEARRRQLEFTADASHELRTPLSVIEAEVDLALRVQRDAPAYREALERVRGESGRLLRIVEDLLFLARFDATPPPPAREPVDVAVIATDCAERFGALASARSVALSVEQRGEGTALLNAPPELIDRLIGVLVDNACRYTPAGGRATVTVEARLGRVVLAVEDSGPGVSPEQRGRLFDRFQRASDEPGGSGLGLAIADSIVRSTGGRWQVGDAALGGARFAVTWHRPHGRERAPAPGPSRPGTPVPTG
jgi:signal transduction histidine kinase